MANILKTSRIATPHVDAATGEARRLVDGLQDLRNESIARHRKRTGKSTHAIHPGSPTSRYRKVNGRYRWEMT